MQLDHIGVAVRSIEHALPRWERLFGYRPQTEIVVNTRQKVRVVFLEKPGSIPIKLVEPTDPTSPLATFVQRGGGLHHLCFRSGSVEDEVTRLREFGARVISEPQPGEAFDDETIAFVYAAGFNIELIDTEKRARRLP